MCHIASFAFKLAPNRPYVRLPLAALVGHNDRIEKAAK